MALDARGLEVKTDEVLDALARERSRLLTAVDALGPRAETAFVIKQVNLEVIPHGAEIALLRDLYRATH
jgi:hypothetical protein